MVWRGVRRRNEVGAQRAIAVIPARFGSTRLPGKPLLRETGKALIQHVYERVVQARGLAEVVVATDDDRIADAVRGFGGQSVMTSAEHRSGTDRIAEVLRHRDATIVVNVQGDEPEIDPASIERVLGLVDPARFPMATLAAPIEDETRWRNAAQVKVVVGADGGALYFSRAPIPALGAEGFVEARARDGNAFLGHIGLYAYTRDFLFEFTRWAPGRLEQRERLEQLRALENGARIRVGLVAEGPRGIDTPEDYRRFVERMRGGAGGGDVARRAPGEGEAGS